jgi:hypothetical protein
VSPKGHMGSPPRRGDARGVRQGGEHEVSLPRRGHDALRLGILINVILFFKYLCYSTNIPFIFCYAKQFSTQFWITIDCQ